MSLRARMGLLAAVATLIFSPAAAAQYGRPTDGPTQVEIAVVLLDVERIDDANQGFHANVFFVARWSDPRLAHDGQEVVWRDLSEVWYPRLQVVNRRQVDATLPQTVEVAPDGTVIYRQRVLGEFSQKLHLGDFPLDRQTFAIQVVAVGYSEQAVVFTAMPEIPSGVVSELSIWDWEILGTRAEPRAYQPLPEVQPTAGFALEFDARRIVGYYVWKIVLPLLLIVGMSWLVFWVDPELAAPRISLAVTSMLTLIAYRFMVGGMLPRISYLTRMDRFTTASTVLVFLTLVVATLGVASTRREEPARAQTVDRFSRWGFPLAYVLVFLWAFVI